MSGAALIRIAVGAAAVTLAALGLLTNAYYWSVVMAADPIGRAIWVGCSIASSVVKIALPALAVVTGRPLWRWPSVAGLLAIALAFDTLSAIGFSALTRGAAVADGVKIAEARRATEYDLTAIRQRLASVPTDVRAASVIAAERNPLQIIVGSCESERAASTKTCRKISALTVELTAAVERDELNKQLAALRDKLAALPTGAASDPQSEAVARALHVIWPQLTAGDVAPWLGLLLFLLIEVGATVGVAAAVAPADADKPVRPSVAPVVAPAPSGLADMIRAARAGRPMPGMRTDGADVVTTYANLAALLSVSRSTVSRRLAALVASGEITCVADRSGVRIRLLGHNLRLVTNG